MTVTLNGCEMSSRAAAHAHLAARLTFPDWYGGNLDALYDLLTERGEDTELVLEQSALVRECLGSYGEALLDTLRDAAADNPHLRITLR